jgi:signal transduction histidine kinase
MNQFFNYFVKISAICLGLIVVAAVTENFLSILPAGTILTALAFFSALVAVVLTLKSKSLSNRAFAESIALIAIADILFYLVNYYQALQPQQTAVTVISTFLYALGFLRATQGFVQSTSWSLKRDLKKLVIPTLIIGFTFTYYFLPSLLSANSQSNSNAIWIALYFNSVANLLISIVALTTLIYSMNPLLNMMALGFSMLPLVNFAISYEINLKGSIAFGFYEYCWAIALLLIEVSLIHENRYPSNYVKQSLESTRSIAVRYKTLMIATTAALLLLSPLIGGSGLSIRFVVLALIFSMVISMLISSFTVAAITHYSKTLGYYLEQGFTQSSEQKNSALRLPSEIETLFSSAFAQSMQQQQERQVRLLRDRELHQKFAHDVRSPLHALDQLLNSAQFEHQDEKDACQNALRTMMKSSEEILGYLMPLENRVRGSVPATHVVDCFRRSQSIFKSAYPQALMSVQLKVETANTYAWIDELVLKRLFLNLIQNAVESTGSTELVVTLNRNELTEDSPLRVTVTDNGRGASMNDIQALNDSQAFTRKINGHGIGLSTQANSLRPYGASLKFSSLEGQSFTATLNLKGASNTIILIDDDRAIQLAWRALAAEKGVKIELVRMSELSQLESTLKSHERHIEIYVDYYLGAQSGKTILARLKKIGFQNLFLATASAETSLQTSEWTVRDKTFPR